MRYLNFTRKAGAREILKALSTGPKTFSNLARVINVHTLQRRLREFMAEGLVSRRVLADRRVEYRLAFRGLELASRLAAIDRSLTSDLRRLMGKWYDDFIADWTAYWKIRDTLLREHRGRYVALCDGEVVAVGDSLLEVASRAQEKCGVRPMYIAKVGEELVPHVLRSPRLEGTGERHETGGRMGL
ncbi:TPA: transcriptional regulator [Candidatus Bathyarchaeota archaeon]|nr:transcriptional regulator [Candidatus Bathyarchaeota archaeon]